MLNPEALCPHNSSVNSTTYMKSYSRGSPDGELLFTYDGQNRNTYHTKDFNKYFKDKGISFTGDDSYDR